MKTKITIYGLAIVTAITIAVGGTAMPVNASASQNSDAGVGVLLPGGEATEQSEFWTTDEFESWMEMQRTENQKLADSGDVSFYEKGSDGNYVCRPWTQKDVDDLFAMCQNQLTMMKQGYQFTKSVTLSDGGILTGVFGPETWNANPAITLGSTIITLPDGSTLDLCHFDTAEEATAAVKEYLKQQVANRTLTQKQADTILANASMD